MKSKWIDTQGHRVLFCDYANFSTDLEGLKAEIASAQAIVAQQPPESILALIDIRNTFVAVEAARVFRQAAADAKPYFRKTAVVGINSLLNIGAKSVIMFSGLQFSLFTDLDSATDWLTE